MSPDKKPRKRRRARQATAPKIRTRPSRDDAHQIVYFKRHREDDPAETVPGREFLALCSSKVRAAMRAVLVAVAEAPPHRFAGGGYWEAMKGDMAGWFEVRVDGPKRHHYRLFCLIDLDAHNADKPLLVVVTGLDKPFRTELGDADYAEVRTLGKEFLSRNPRSIA
jgi:hypothetical protein